MKSKEMMQGLVMCKEKYHENEVVEYYCKDCRVCICLKCGQTRHNHHNKMDVSQAVDERKTQMSKLVERAKAKTVEVEARMKKQAELMEESENDICFAEEEMLKTVEESIQLLNEHKTAMKTELAEIRKAQKTKHANKMESFQMFATELKKSIEYHEDAVKESTGLEILQGECTSSLDRCEELLNAEKMEVYQPKYVTYQVNNETAGLIPGEIVAFHIEPKQPVTEGEGLIRAKLGAESSFTATVRDSEGCRPPVEETMKICSSTEYKVTGSLTGRSYGEGQGRFDQPYSIAVSRRTANIAIAELWNKRVQLFDSEWKYLRTIGDKGTGDEIIEQPLSVAFTPSGDVIVVHGSISLPKKISIFTERGGFVKHIMEHVKRPTNVSLGRDSSLIVCARGDKRVQVLSPDGKHLIQTVSAPDCNESPRFAICHQDMFFVLYQRDSSIRVFSKDGQLLYKIGCKGTGDGQLREPTGLIIDRLGNLVVCDSGNKRIQIFSLEGKFLNSVNKGMEFPRSVAVTENGDLLVCDSGLDKICVHILH